MGCEETEISIRLRQRRPGARIVYEPAAHVRHLVTPGRGTWSYFFTRCWAEGRSKALLTDLVGSGDGLSSERTYATRTLPLGVLHGLRDALQRRRRRARAGGRDHGRPARHGRRVPARDARAWAGRVSDGPRVLMVTPRYLPEMGGVERHVHEVATRLHARGTAVRVLTTDRTGTLPAFDTRRGRRRAARPRAAVGPRLALRARVCPRRCARASGTSCTCRATTRPSRRWRCAPRAGTGSPYVVTFHGGGHSQALRHSSRPLQRRVLAPLLRGADRLVAVAQFEIEQYGAELGLPPERFALIPNGVDLPRAARGSAPRAARSRRRRSSHPSGASRRTRAIAASSRHSRSCSSSFPGARLWIAGSGPDEQHLRDLASRLGIAARVDVRAVPATDRLAMARELAGTSLVTLLSEFETHPIAALEALSLGRPLLVGTGSGVGELADRGLARSVPVGRDARAGRAARSSTSCAIR